MNRRKFFAFLTALTALPAICKGMVKSKFWEGTSIPAVRDAWRELEEAEERLRQNTGKTDLGYGRFAINAQIDELALGIHKPIIKRRGI